MAAGSWPLDRGRPARDRGARRAPTLQRGPADDSILSAHMVEQRYVMVGALGRSEVAATLAARLSGATELDRWVVLKFPRQGLLPTSRDAQAFVAECQRLARLSHDHLVPIEDAGMFAQDEVEAAPELAELVGSGAAPFVAYPYLPGETLTGVLEAMAARGRLMVAELAAYLVANVCDALDYAYAGPTGVVHGNLGPQNVLLTYAGAVKAMDIGLERALGLDRARYAPTVRSLAHMAPERVRGEDPSHGADLFSLGVLMWEAVAGQPLFRGRDVPHTMQLVRDCYVPSLREVTPDIPPDFAAIVGRALARERSGRYDSAYELGRDLRRFLASRGAALSAAELARIMVDLFGDRAREIDPLRRTVQGVDPSRALVVRPTTSRTPVRRSLSVSGRPLPAPAPAERATEDMPHPPRAAEASAKGRATVPVSDAWSKAIARRDGADPRGIGGDASAALGTPLPDLARVSMLDMQLQDPVMVAPPAKPPVPDPSEPHKLVPAPLPASLRGGIPPPSRSPAPVPVTGVPLVPPRSISSGPRAASSPGAAPRSVSSPGSPSRSPVPSALVPGVLDHVPPPPASQHDGPEAISPAASHAAAGPLDAPTPPTWRVGPGSPAPSFDMADLRRPRSDGLPVLPGPSSTQPDTSLPGEARPMDGVAWPPTPTGEPLDLRSPRPWWQSPPALLGLLCMVAAAALIVMVGRRQSEPVVQPLPDEPAASAPASAPSVVPAPDAHAAVSASPAPVGGALPEHAAAVTSVVDAAVHERDSGAAAAVPAAAATAPAARPSPAASASGGVAVEPAAPPVPAAHVEAAPAEAEDESAEDAIDIGAGLAEDGRKALEAGDLVKAEKLLDDCVQFGGPDACLRDLGAVHEKRGRTDSARAAYQAYLAAAPGAPDRAAVEARITALAATQPR